MIQVKKEYLEILTMNKKDNNFFQNKIWSCLPK